MASLRMGVGWVYFYLYLTKREWVTDRERGPMNVLFYAALKEETTRTKTKYSILWAGIVNEQSNFYTKNNFSLDFIILK